LKYTFNLGIISTFVPIFIEVFIALECDAKGKKKVLKIVYRNKIEIACTKKLKSRHTSNDQFCKINQFINKNAFDGTLCCLIDVAICYLHPSDIWSLTNDLD